MSEENKNDNGEKTNVSEQQNGAVAGQESVNGENAQGGTVTSEGVNPATGVTAEEQSRMNRDAEERALNEAADKSQATIAGDSVEAQTKEEVFFEGRKVVEILPKEMQIQPNFVHCKMSDGTTMLVPAGLFTEEDLRSIDEKAAEVAQDRADQAQEEADKARSSVAGESLGGGTTGPVSDEGQVSVKNS